MTSGTLTAALSALLERTGAEAARVLDGRTGTVLGAVGPPAGDDVPALVRLAAQAGTAAVAGGGLDDLVLATRRSVHVLRAGGVPGSVLHLRLAPGRGDLAAARRELAASRLPAALRAVPPAEPTERAEPAELAALPPAPVEGQPALAALRPSPRPRTAELALRALGSMGALPRRIPAQVAADRPTQPAGVEGAPGQSPGQYWANDPDTLRRLLVALRRPGR